MRFQFRSAEGSREGGKKPEARHKSPLSSTATKLLLQLHNVCCHLKAINMPLPLSDFQGKSFEECNYCTQCDDRVITTIFFHTQLSVMQK